MKKNYGKVIIGEETYTLTQNPYPESGSFNVPDGGNYNGNWYQASAVNPEGNEFMVYWTSVDWNTEDSENACDWDNPDYIQAI